MFHAKFPKLGPSIPPVHSSVFVAANLSLPWPRPVATSFVAPHQISFHAELVSHQNLHVWAIGGWRRLQQLGQLWVNLNCSHFEFGEFSTIGFAVDELWWGDTAASPIAAILLNLLVPTGDLSNILPTTLTIGGNPNVRPEVFLHNVKDFAGKLLFITLPQESSY